MQKNYLIAAFEQTAVERFPAQGPELLAAMHRRIEALREDNAGASQELWAHLESQIMPGIAIYEVLQTVVSKEEALQLIHGYVNAHARKYHTLVPPPAEAAGAVPRDARHLCKGRGGKVRPCRRVPVPHP